MPLYLWSTTPNINATADPTINWAEGQPPSSVNDSARAMMARIAEYRQDICGGTGVSGTSTALTLGSAQGYDTLAHLNGQVIAFTPSATNTGSVTLNVDGLGAKPLRMAPGVDLPSNTLIVNTPYVATYFDDSGEFILHGGAFSNPFGIPLAGGLDYWGPTAPNSAFAFPAGQALSRVTYATLFNIIGTTYGAGDGSSTFNLPDKRGRVTAATANMGGTDSGRLNNGGLSSVAFIVGGAGGEDSHTLTASEIPTIDSANTNAPSVSFSGASTLSNIGIGATLFTTAGGSFSFDAIAGVGTVTVAGSGNIVANSIASQSNNTGGNSHNNVQPTILCNYIMRII